MKSINRRSKEEIEKFYHVNFAHRGLHDIKKGIAENSLTAFKEAAASGYGAELDVQLSKDGQVVVFHDDDLKRVCGIEKRVDELSYDELNKLSLLGTPDTVPLFTEVLEVFEKGTGPLIVELKTGSGNQELCRKTLDILKTYKGNFCIESFNPFIVKWFKDNAPEIFRGQLATYKEAYKASAPAFARAMLASCSFSFLNKPDFIAYYNFPEEEKNERTMLWDRPKAVKRLIKKGIMLVAWTSKKPDIDQKNNDAVIFEQYRPSLKY